MIWDLPAECIILLTSSVIQQALAGSVLICDNDLEIFNLHLGVKDSGLQKLEHLKSGSNLFELQVRCQ